MSFSFMPRTVKVSLLQQQNLATCMCSTLYGHYYIYDDDDIHNTKLDSDHCTICMCSRLLPTKIPSWRKITIIAISQGIIFDKVYCHALLKYFHISFLLPLMWLLKWIICWGDADVIKMVPRSSRGWRLWWYWLQCWYQGGKNIIYHFLNFY